MEKVMEDNWGYQDVLSYLANNLVGSLDTDNDGQVIIYTGLYEAQDGSLVDENPNEDGE